MKQNWLLKFGLFIVLISVSLPAVYAKNGNFVIRNYSMYPTPGECLFCSSAITGTSDEFKGAGDEATYSIKIDKNAKTQVSSLLLGFNIVYAYESDSIWRDGKIEGYLKDVKTSIIRYPGGTVSSYYHWNSLTGEGWKDSWDPQNPVRQKPESEFMDLDEYITLIKKTGITPLVGINMSSGRRWNRTGDGIREAVDLMKYCKGKGMNVKFWYLDNEPYQHDSNGGSKTIEEYAGMINQYVPRMKEFDPDIKVIVNWKSAIRNYRDDYRKLLTISGKHIDIIDVHWYWSWYKPTFEKWLENTPMEVRTGNNYLEEINYFQLMASEFGYPGIQLASLEWNVGPIREKQLAPPQCALIQAEMMMQFIMGGLDMATFWPIQGAGEALTTRSFVRRTDRTAQPDYEIFKFLGKMQGGDMLKYVVTVSQPNVLSLVAQDKDGGTIRICFLNKNKGDVSVNIKSDLFIKMKLDEASIFVLSEQGNGNGIIPVKLSKQIGSEISFTAPDISLTMLSFEKK